MNGFCSTGHPVGDVLCWTVIGIMAFSLYNLPWAVAEHRDHHHAGRIFLFNLLLGWTVIGMIVAFAWAFGPVKPKTDQTSLQERAEASIAPPASRVSPMPSHALLVRARWDPEARLWTAASDDLPGLAVQAPSHDELMARLQATVPQLLTERQTAPQGEGTSSEVPLVVVSEHVSKLRLPG